MKKRVLSSILTIVMLACLFAGCSAASTNEDGSVEEAKAIVYWTMWGKSSVRGKVIKDAASQYEADTGIKVKVYYKGEEYVRDGLKAAIEKGDQIDLFDYDMDYMNGNWQDYLLDLEEYAAGSEYEKTAWPVLINAAREAGGGTLMSIPYAPSIFAFFYNQEMFRTAGIEKAPETWDEFLDACGKLKAADIVPLTTDDDYALCLLGNHLSRLVGEERTKEVVREGSWGDEALLNAVGQYEFLAQQESFTEYIDENIWPTAQVTELAGGEAAMYLNTSNMMEEVKDVAGEDFEWGCFPYPAITSGTDGTDYVQLSTKAYGIYKESDFTREAYDFITFMTKGEIDQRMSEEAIQIPADQTNKTWPEELECVKPVFQAMTVRYNWAAGVETNTLMNDKLQKNFLKVCAGKMTAEEFSKAMYEIEE